MTSFLMNIYVFILGLVLGSFYNVVGLRSTEGQSIMFPPSRCPSCGQRLPWLDLVPVFSYLMLRGRCRTCRRKISPIYPIVEASTGLLFLLSFQNAASAGEMLAGCLLSSLLMIVLVTDLSKMIIPDRIVLFFLVLFALFRTIFRLDPWWDAALGSAVGFGLPAIMAVLSRGGIGGGDVKLFAAMGLLVGSKLILLGFFFSTLYGALIGMAGLLTGRIKRRQPIPFVPFIAPGMVTAFFFGDALLDAYFRFIT
ncbi:prepilin peptidase [Sporolactobacillus sp. THM7-7]|nr:prepilin peptidase [Sporolactobacillus sp. THM7-7]